MSDTETPVTYRYNAVCETCNSSKEFDTEREAIGWFKFHYHGENS